MCRNTSCSEVADTLSLQGSAMVHRSESSSSVLLRLFVKGAKRDFMSNNMSGWLIVVPKLFFTSFSIAPLVSLFTHFRSTSLFAPPFDPLSAFVGRR